MATPEGKVKDAIKEWLDARGFWKAGGPRPECAVRGWWYMPQNMGMGVSGIPDFVGSFKCRRYGYRPFAIEAKADGQPTALQLDRHHEMRTAGWLVIVARGTADLAELENALG